MSSTSTRKRRRNVNGNANHNNDITDNHPSSIHDNLRQSLAALSKETRITSRRAQIKKVSNILQSSTQLKRLRQESIHHARNHPTDGSYMPFQQFTKDVNLFMGTALDISHSLLLKGSKSSSSSGSSMGEDEILFPIRVWNQVEQDNNQAFKQSRDAWKAASSSSSRNKNSKNSYSYSCTLFSFESFDRYRGTQTNVTTLSKENIIGLIYYCLSCLNLEPISGESDVESSDQDQYQYQYQYQDSSDKLLFIKRQNPNYFKLKDCQDRILKALERITQRPDHISRLDPESHFLDLLQLCHTKLLNQHGLGGHTHGGSGGGGGGGNGGGSGGSSIHYGNKSDGYVARIFYNLISVAVGSLGFGFEFLVKLSLGLVVDWAQSCRLNQHERGTTDSGVISPFYGAIVHLFLAYPHQCISLLKSEKHQGMREEEEECWGIILYEYAKICWRDILTRDALVDYFSAHLTICEVAGHEQGLLPGDLGDIGDATLVNGEITYLLQLLLSREELIRLQDDKPTKAKGYNSNQGIMMKALCKNQRKHLDLIVRLLKAAQRYFLADAEYKETTIPADGCDGLFTSLSDISSHGDDKMLQCPWNYFIWNNVHSFGSIRHDALEEKLSSGVINDGKEPGGSSIKFGGKVPQSKIGQDDEFLIISYLRIICACSEIFPRGECWSSSNQWHETTYSPLDNDDLDPIHKSRTYCNTCSLTDMTSIIKSISSLLRKHGGAGGDVRIQMWTLICLLKLTESSTIACRYWSEDEDTGSLERAWQIVWTILLSPDLRYMSYTSKPVPLSLGDLVIMLLTETIRCSLTDLDPVRKSLTHEVNLSSFVRINQNQIWNLPVFKSTCLIIASHFELATVLIRRVGLIENGDDSIVANKAMDFFEQKESENVVHSFQRRQRIGSYCLSSILDLSKVSSEIQRRVIPSLSSCYSSLLGDINVTFFSAYSILATRTLRCTEAELETNDHGFEAKIQLPEVLDLNVLWTDSMLPFSVQYSIEQNRQMWDHLHGREYRISPPWSLEERQWMKEKITKLDNCSVDFVSFPVRKILRESAVSLICHFAKEDRAEHFPESATAQDSYLEESLSTGSTRSSKIIIDGRSSSFEDYKATLLFKISLFKIFLAFTLCAKDEEIGKNDLTDHSDVLAELLKNITSFMERREGGECVDMACVLIDLVGILRAIQNFFVTTADTERIDHLRFQGKEISNLLHQCRVILKLYVENRKLDEDKESIDSDSDNDSDNPRKSTHNKRAKKAGMNSSNERLVHTFNPDAKTAWVCSQVMLLLDPRKETCHFIANHMVWPIDLAKSQKVKYGLLFDTNEPHDSILCCGLLSYQTSLIDSNPNDKDTLSPFEMCSEAIIEGRTRADLSSPFFMFGFNTCQIMMERRSLQGWDEHALSTEERGDIIAVMDEKRTLSYRPRLWLNRLQAATLCFMNADPSFHQDFDKTFAAGIVMPSLSHINSAVRRCAIDALGACFQIFPKQKQIFEDLLRKAPSFLVVKNVSEFDQWLEQKRNGRNHHGHKSEMEIDAWNQSRNVLAVEYVKCLGMVVGTSRGSDTKVKTEAINRLIETSAKYPRLQMICFYTLEQISSIRGFPKLVHMLRREQKLYWQDWINGERKFLELPLSISGPGFLRSILRLGRARDFVKNPENSLNMSDLRLMATIDFLSLNAWTLIPDILLAHVHAQGGDSKKCWKILRHVSSFLIGEEESKTTDNDVRKVLRSHLHDILAHVYPLIHTSSSLSNAIELRKKGDAVLKFLENCLTLNVVRNRSKRKAHLLVQQILKLGVRRSVLNGDEITLERTVLTKAIENAAKHCVDNGNAKNIFKRAGTSAIECLLHVLQWLDEALNIDERCEIWYVIDFIISEVQSKEDTKDQGQFCINVLLDLALSSNNVQIRPQILEKLMGLVRDLLFGHISIETSHETKRIINKICATMIHLHEEGQNDLVNYCTNKHRGEIIYYRTGLGFIPLESSDLPYPNDGFFHQMKSIKLAVQKCGHSAPKDILSTIEITYDLLYLILVDQSEFLGKNSVPIDPFPEPETSSEILEELSKVNKKTILPRTFYSIHDGREERSSLVSELTVFLFHSSNFRGKRSSPKKLRLTSLITERSVASFEVRSLEIAINRLMKLLSEAPIQLEEDNTIMLKESMYKLIKELSILCTADLPDRIRVKASQCLGEITQNINVSLSSHSCLNGKRNDNARSLEDPNLGVQIAAFENLIKLIESDDVDTAIIAKDTAIHLMTTDDGRKLLELLGPRHEFKNILSMRRDASSKERPTISDTILKELNVNTQDCWSDETWNCNNGMITFKVWIKKVVCSLLLCCYDTQSNKIGEGKTILGGSDFYPVCSQLCSCNSEFAAVVFPGIIFDLLKSDLRHDEFHEYQASHLVGAPFSLANQKITTSFSNLLKNSDSVNQQAIQIIIDVLDMLRRHTEYKFLDGANRKKLSRPEWKVWHGRPYGTVCVLNGIELASCYLKRKDVTSALYYAEMFADNRLGGSGNVFERVDGGDNVESSISGFGIPLNDHIQFGGIAAEGKYENKNGRLKSLENILMQSYKEYRDSEALEGLEEQTLALHFRDSNNVAAGSGLMTNMEQMMALDLSAQVKTGCGDPIQPFDTDNIQPLNSDIIHSQLGIASCLGRLGMRDILHNYIAGLCHRHNLSVDVDNRALQEKWAEETWRLLQWDESLLPGGKQQSPFLSFNKDLVRDSLKEGDQVGNKIGFHQSLSNSLFFLICDDSENFASEILRTRKLLLSEFNDIYGLNFLSKDMICHSLRLRSMNEMDDLGNVVSKRMRLNDWIGKWCTSSNILSMDITSGIPFSAMEEALATREICLKILYNKLEDNDERDELGRVYFRHLHSYCSIARRYRRPHIASAVLKRLKRFAEISLFGNDDNEVRLKVDMKSRMEEANILYSSGNSTAAIRISKLVLKNISDFREIQNEPTKEDLDFLLVETYLQCGNWLVSNQIDSASIILKEYLQPASRLADSLENSAKRSILVAQSNFALADFVANLYDNAEKRLHSHEYQIFATAADGRKKECDKILELIKDVEKQHKSSKSSEEKAKLQTKYKVLKYEQKNLQREKAIDVREKDGLLDSIQNYLEIATEAYSTALSTSSNYQSSIRPVFRFISIWFRNSGNKHNDVHELLDKALSKIPSFHFVPLIYQIFSRLELKNAPDGFERQIGFQYVLHSLITRICIDHPYHGIIQLIALSNGNKVVGKRAGTYLKNVGNAKVEATKEVLQNIKIQGPGYVSKLINSYEILADAYISLAMAPTTPLVNQKKTKNVSFAYFKDHTGGKRMDTCLGESSRRKMPCPPCILTRPPPVRPGKDYGDGETDPIGAERIARFCPDFSLTDTGLHRPKIIECIGTKGGRYKQVVKGDDDIRQDAIMQQVFVTVNFLLRNQVLTNESMSIEAYQRILRLVTYNCIPLSPDSGVLEWVENTVPFGACLVGNRGMHNTYYPKEWDNYTCRKKLMEATDKREAFDEICENFSPAFRFFFLERFRGSTQLWHESRTRYVRSCAVSSMVGHILGIGDRHASNILMNEVTGELVHIDFGIVFEQGKVLTIPEKIPFRLTRDIVDGMGPTGTAGTYTAAAQATLKVLRENSSTLLTVLSAVVSDPLYSWCVSPIKAREMQLDENENEGEHEKYERPRIERVNGEMAAAMDKNENDAATRTISRINEKLQGYEDGTMGERQTVESQVRHLIARARDRDNLSQIFHGWSPWL